MTITLGDSKTESARLAAEGLALEDLSVAIAGRTDIKRDPPYLVYAGRG